MHKKATFVRSIKKKIFFRILFDPPCMVPCQEKYNDFIVTNDKQSPIKMQILINQAILDLK